MRVKMPSVKIEGDRHDRIMGRSGHVVGITKSRLVWRFGFLPESDNAKAFGVQVDDFHWVLADKAGNVIAEHHGFGKELPSRFWDVVEGKL